MKYNKTVIVCFDGFNAAVEYRKIIARLIYHN